MPRLGSAKSRGGCTQCKRRRVKCDESAPCANCVRRIEECSLLQTQQVRVDEHRIRVADSLGGIRPRGLGSSAAPLDLLTPESHHVSTVQSPASPVTASRLQQPTSSSAPNQSDAAWLQDLELMYHYTHKASSSNLGTGLRFQYLWQTEIPLAATRHTFLMHGIMALSSLHLASLKPSKSLALATYLSLSDHHQALALEAYRTTLSSRADEASDALFAYSMVLPVTSRARSVLRVLDNNGAAMPLEEIAEHLSLIRGVRDVVGAVRSTVARGPFSVVLYGHEIPSNVMVVLSQPLLALFADLEAILRDECGEETLELCLGGLTCLRKAYERIVYYRSLDGGNGELKMSHIWRSIVDLPYEYFTLVHDAYPPALVVVAHFCLATILLSEPWLAATWGKFAYEGVLLALDGKLGKSLVWAREQIGTDLAGLKGEAAGKVEAVRSESMGESPVSRMGM